MIDTIGIVRRFHKAFKVPPGPPRPSLPEWNPRVGEVLQAMSDILANAARQLHSNAAEHNANVLLSRAQLMVEEMGEVLEAMAKNDVPATLHELCDQRVVNDGTLLRFGMERMFPAAFRAIDAANMSKLDEHGEPVVNEAGRIVKGPNFKKADIRALLLELGEIDP